MKQALTYDDVLLVPQYSDIKSRQEIDIGSYLDNHIHLDLPIISSPMDTVTESDMSIAMHNAGGLGVMHRYNTIKEQCNMVRKCAYTAAAVGVTGDYLKRAVNLFDIGDLYQQYENATGDEKQELKKKIQEQENHFLIHLLT